MRTASSNSALERCWEKPKIQAEDCPEDFDRRSALASSVGCARATSPLYFLSLQAFPRAAWTEKSEALYTLVEVRQGMGRRGDLDLLRSVGEGWRGDLDLLGSVGVDVSCRSRGLRRLRLGDRLGEGRLGLLREVEGLVGGVMSGRMESTAAWKKGRARGPSTSGSKSGPRRCRDLMRAETRATLPT